MTQITHHVKVGFEQRKPRRHRVLDVLSLLFAAALIGTVFDSPTLFAVLGAVFLVVYVFSTRAVPGAPQA